MKRLVSLFIALASLTVFTGTGYGQIHFTLGFADCPQKIVGAPNSRVEFDIIATITQENFEANKGASGFSIGFRGENVDLLDGTAASGATCGTGDVIIPITEFFCSAQTVDPARTPDSGPLAGGPQGEGYVDGLAFQIGKSLQGNATFNIGKVRGAVTIPAAGSSTARLFFADGLQGSGQPVKNGITSGGKTIDAATGQLTLGECSFSVEAEPPVINVEVEVESPTISAAPGVKASGVAYIVVDSQLMTTEGPSGWQFSVAYNDVLAVKSITAASAIFTAVPDLGGSLGFLESYHSEGTPPLFVDPARLYQVSDPVIEADCDLTVGQPQGKGLVSGAVFALPPTPGKAQYLPGASRTRVLRIEFEQANAFSAGGPTEETGTFEWKDCLQGPGVKIKNGLTVTGNTIRPKERVGASVTFKAAPTAAFRSGDANNDDRTNIADPIFLINALFRGGPGCGCPDACDANGDQSLGIADAAYLLMYLFDDGPDPVGGTACHTDPESTQESCPAGSTTCI
jgi:hypothetical protein